VAIWTGQGAVAQLRVVLVLVTIKGCEGRLMVMKTGDSVSPCLFVQAGTVSAAATATGIQKIFFMALTFMTE
jgi:hypothetical protein